MTRPGHGAGGDHAPDPAGDQRRDASGTQRPGSGDAGRPGPLVAGHPLPPRLEEGRDPELLAWRERLPALVEELLARWELEASAPFLPGGSSAWVAPVRDRDGAERVLKVAWAHEESRDEAAGMRAWQGRGAARLFRWARDGDTAALLLERVRPGVPLAEQLTWPERDEVIVEVARRLWVPPAQLLGHGAADLAAGMAGETGEASASLFRPLAHMCAWWADEALQKGAGERAGLPRELVERGLDLFRSLPMHWDGEQVLLATDLHPGNVLSGGTVQGGSVDGGGDGAGTRLGRRWLLIDPKPYVGDPHYDLLQHMLNDMDRLHSDPGRFAERMADLAGLDRDRTRQWLLARCVQEADEPGGLAEVALRLAADAGW